MVEDADLDGRDTHAAPRPERPNGDAPAAKRRGGVLPDMVKMHWKLLRGRCHDVLVDVDANGWYARCLRLSPPKSELGRRRPPPPPPPTRYAILGAFLTTGLLILLTWKTWQLTQVWRRRGLRAPAACDPGPEAAQHKRPPPLHLPRT